MKRSAASMADDREYPLVTDAALQRFAAILLLENSDFLRAFYDIVRPEHFASPEMGFLVEFVQAFFTQHRIAPTLDSFALEVESPSRSWIATGIRPELMDVLVEALQEEGIPSDALTEYVKGRFEQYIQEREFALAVRTASKFLDSGEPDKAFEAVRAAQRVKAQDDDRILFPEQVATLFEYFDSEHLDRISLPSGIKTLDMAMEKGLRPGELGVIMAPLKRGKSMWLVHVGAHALRRGETVAHYSLELSAHDTLARYAANVCGMPLKELMALGIDEVKRLLNRALRVGDRSAQVIIHWMPARGTSIDMIAADLENLRAEHHIGLVIVDYGDLARSRQRHEKSYDEQAEVFTELRDLGMQYRVPVWTATQANRKALDSDRISINQIAESLGKAMKADFVVAMSQTSTEREHDPQFMRLNIVAARRGSGKCNARVEARLDRAKFVQSDALEEEEVEADESED